MATIGNDNGRKRILFVAADGERKTVRLGKVSQRDAEQVCRQVEALASASIHGQPVSREAVVWLSGIGETLHDRLARVGLVEPRERAERPKLSAFIDGYIAQRPDLKASTLAVYQQSRIWLVRFMGDDKYLDEVTPADADAYKVHMMASGLARATIAKRCRYARQFFKVAIQRGLIESIRSATSQGP